MGWFVLAPCASAAMLAGGRILSGLVPCVFNSFRELTKIASAAEGTLFFFFLFLLPVLRTAAHFFDIVFSCLREGTHGEIEN